MTYMLTSAGTEAVGTVRSTVWQPASGSAANSANAGQARLRHRGPGLVRVGIGMAWDLLRGGRGLIIDEADPALVGAKQVRVVGRGIDAVDAAQEPGLRVGRVLEAVIGLGDLVGP